MYDLRTKNQWTGTEQFVAHYVMIDWVIFKSQAPLVSAYSFNNMDQPMNTFIDQ